MVAIKFTAKYIEALKPKEKDYTVYDSLITGFGCKITPKSRRVYFYKYRNLAQRYVKLTIGKHGLFTTDNARKIAGEYAAKVARGVDPRAEKEEKKEEQKQSMLFKDFWQIYEEKYRAVENKKSTIEKSKSRVKYILDFFGHKNLSSITRDDLVEFEKKLVSMTLGKSIFTKCWKELLSPALNHAEIWGYRPHGSNPCFKLYQYTPKKINNILGEDQIKKFIEFLDQYEAQNSQTKAAIYLYLYCGFRHSELLALKWEDVEIRDNQLYFKDSKTGEKVLPLHKKAVEVFQSIPKKEGNPYVFYGKKDGKPLTTVDSLWGRIKQKAGINIRLHDLRHTFITHTLRKTNNLALTSKLAGHKNIQTTMRYVHLTADTDLRAGIDKVGEIFE